MEKFRLLKAVFLALALIIVSCCKAFAGTTNMEFEIINLLVAIEEENQSLLQRYQVQPNEIGDIMIIMYHGLVEGESSNNVDRSVSDFKNDLALLYEKGYRLIRIEDLVYNNINVEAGYTPVIITFDDGKSSAFSLIERNGILEVVPNCAVDIINEFCEHHPDFGKGAVFYINGSNPFIGAGTLEQRLNYLKHTGYEIGNHTYSHKSLKNINISQIQNEIGRLDAYIANLVEGYKMLTFCYPYGHRPLDDSLKSVVLSGKHGEHAYSYCMALREGPTEASAAPNHINFDPLNIPRIRGTDIEEYDLGWYLRYYEQNPHLKYISDGNPNTVSVPSGIYHLVNTESLGDKTLMLY